MTTSKEVAAILHAQSLGKPRRNSGAMLSDADLASVDQTPITVDVFLECMRQLCLVYDAPPLSEDRVQAMLDLFREDQWLNRHLRFACKWLVRNQTKMPVYADFMRWRKSEDGPDYAG